MKLKSIEAAEAIRISEARLKRAELTFKSGHWELHLESNRIIASDGANKLYGLAEGMLDYETIKTIPLPEYRQPLDAALKNLIEKDEPYDIEFKIRTADTGEIRDIHSISQYDRKNRIVFGVIQDITERRKAENALRESEAFLSNLLNTIPIPVFYKDINGRYLDANDSFVSLFGYTREQLSGKTVFEFHPPELAMKYSEMDNKLFNASATQVYESRLVDSNGREHDVQFHKAVCKNSLNEVTGIIGAILDITEQKQAREDLQKSEKKFRNLFDKSPLGKSMTGIDGSLDVNQSFCDLLGYTAEELRSGTWHNITHPDDIKKSEEEAGMLLNGKKDRTSFEKRFIHKNGSIIWAEVSVYLERNEKGDPMWFITAVNDITARKGAEDEIRSLNEELEQRVSDRTKKLEISQQNYKEIFEVSPVSIWKEDWSDLISAVKKLKENGVTDFKSYFDLHPDFISSALLSVRIIDVNPATLVLFGAQNKEQLLESLSAIFSTPDVLPGFADELTALCSGSEIFETDHALRTLNQDLIHVLIRMVFPAPESDSGIVLVNMTDITLREKITADLEKSKLLLQAANKELEAFSYSVSHDLRAPLRSIHSFTSILKEDYGKVLDNEGKRICGIIESSSSRMGQLIDDLLAFSRIGRSHLNFFRIGMVQLSSSVFQELTLPEEREWISFSVMKLPPAFGDSVLIKQVMTNLISNALKYSAKEEKSEIIIGSYQEKDETVYYVRDNGVGFDMKYVNKLFGVFQRLHSTMEFEGNGVGLAIVKRIILRHRGRVWAEGEPEKGATFFFTLPVEKKLV